MIITLANQFKSLRPFKSEEISDFAIITGKNGSGKSQLLDLLSHTIWGDSKYMHYGLTTNPTINSLQYEDIGPDRRSGLTDNDNRTIINNAIQSFSGMSIPAKDVVDRAISEKLNFDQIQNPVEYLKSLPEFDELLKKVGRAELVSGGTFSSTLNSVFNHDGGKLYKIITEVVYYKSKPVAKLEHADFHETPFSDSLLDDPYLFKSRYEVITYNYARRRFINEFEYFRKKEYGKTNDAVSDAEFISKNLPPWKTINAILAELQFDYKVAEVVFSPMTQGIFFPFDLTRSSTGEVIPFKDLSSGEKIILSIILLVFTSDYYQEKTQIPELLILDEPDAHLHPEMSKLLLNVLEDTFVRKLGMKVIITTHSPSTIAVASEDSIFQLTNLPETSLKKITKDDALKLLTGLIPMLSIDYRNHRQVFVESPVDAKYYQYLFEQHNQKNKLEHKLYFISNAQGKGNCDQVSLLVEQLRQSGNQTSFGIIDWDNNNRDKEFVYVHGATERYSLENFLLDPTYVFLLLLDNKHRETEKALKILPSDNHYNFLSDPGKVQEHADYYFSQLPDITKKVSGSLEVVQITYLNGVTVYWPRWYTLKKGHDLVTILQEKFPLIQRKYSKESLLLEKLTEIMARFYPLVPKSSIELLERLAT